MSCSTFRRAWASAASHGSAGPHAQISRLCDAFVWFLGGTPSTADPDVYERAIDSITSPAYAEQVAWLLWRATGDARWETRARSLHDAINGQATGERGELLERDLSARTVLVA